MGCCCSAAPVENSSNNPYKSDDISLLISQTNNNKNNNSIISELNNIDPKAQNDSDSSKTITDDTNTFKIKPDGSTISENNQLSDDDYNALLDLQSYNSEDEYNLAGYKFEKRIGSGGSAEVVQMSKNGVSYAVKIIDLSLNFKANYLQSDHEPTEEVAILKRFDHIHVVKFVDFIDDTDNNKLFIVMELLSGGTIMECKTLEEKREAFTEALSAVQYIHFQRIAHQDIKPANILRHEDGTIKLVDFGAAIFVSEGIKKISSGLTGTTVFSPPEKFTEPMYDPFLGDIWSLGATLYNMLFGKLPFTGSNIFQLQQSIINDEPQFPEDADSDAVDLIRSMLKKNPVDRITCNQIWDHPFLGQVPTTSSMRSLLDSSSRIFESLKSTDTMNSMTRISRGSLRSSLKGTLQKAIKSQVKKAPKKKPKKPQKLSQKPQSQLIKAPKVKLNQDQKPKRTKLQKQEPFQSQRIESPKRQRIDTVEDDNDDDESSRSIANNTNLVEIDSQSEGSLNDQSQLSTNIQKLEIISSKNPVIIKKKEETNYDNNKLLNLEKINIIRKQEGATEVIKKDQKSDLSSSKKIDASRKPKSEGNVTIMINKDQKDAIENDQKQTIKQDHKSDSPRKLKHEQPQAQMTESPRKQKDENANFGNSQKQDNPKKVKTGNKELRPNTSKNIKTRRQSKQFAPKKE